jgi:hypothetical protein
MSRTFKTISDQTMYDLTVERFGQLDDLGKIIRETPDLNNVIPFSTELTVDNTDDELARQFEFRNTRFATGVQLLSEEEVCGIPLSIPGPVGGCGSL